MSNSQVSNIFDLIERKQYNEALRSTNALLSKSSQNPVLLSLKAYILFFLNRRTECYNTAIQARNILNMDIYSIRRLTIVFDLLEKPEEICPIHEHAFNTNPTQQNADSLFISYVQAGLTEKQTKVLFLFYFHNCLFFFYLYAYIYLICIFFSYLFNYISFIIYQCILFGQLLVIFSKL